MTRNFGDDERCQESPATSSRVTAAGGGLLCKQHKHLALSGKGSGILRAIFMAKKLALALISLQNTAHFFFKIVL